MDAHEDRLIELEIKLALQENTLDVLSDIIAKQGQQLELMQQQLRYLYQQQQGGSADAPAASLLDDKPPHY